MDYPQMSIQAICELAPEIAARAKDDCILGMWVTNAFVHEIGRILFAWGIEHRTMITWDKEIAGVGMLPRGQTEHLVIATRGAPVHTLNEITTLLRAKRREHSRKPDEMYELLAKHCAGPRIDMFAREPREGFSIWGAELKKFATEAA
jgi:N6-adenosine-specific RNA methylase IME4